MQMTWQLCCRGMYKIFLRNDTLLWSCTKTKFPSNLNFDGKMVGRNGPLTTNDVKQEVYGSCQETAVVLLPGFAINWEQNQVTRQPQFHDLTHMHCQDTQHAITHYHSLLLIWGLWCQKQVSQAGISTYIPQFTVGVITYSCLRYLLLAPKSPYFVLPHTVLGNTSKHVYHDEKSVRTSMC